MDAGHENLQGAKWSKENYFEKLSATQCNFETFHLFLLSLFEVQYQNFGLPS